jgi:hypothetical protein
MVAQKVALMAGQTAE